MKIRSRKTLFTLIVVGLLTWGGPGCYTSTRGEDDGIEDAGEGTDSVVGSDADSDTDGDGGGDTDTDGDTDSDTDGDTDSDTDGDTDSDTDTGSAPDTDTDTCWEGGWYCEEGKTIETPDPGAAATRAAVCAPATPPVTSNTAATVSLNVYSASPHLATGAIEIAAGLRDHVVGDPVLEVVDATVADLDDLTVSDLQPTATGYAFNASWPPSYAGGGGMAIQVTLTIDCAPGGGAGQATVQSRTNFEWCNDEGYDAPASEGWVGSGGICYWCDCWNGEMAPTPIPLDARPDGIPLPRSFGVVIEKVATIDDALVLVAEHPGSRGPVSYSWEVSAGTLLDDDQGGVVWRLPEGPGPHQVQVAVRDTDSAAVACLRHDS